VKPYAKKLPRKVEFARDAIVAYVSDHSLTAGDRMPSYAALRQLLGVGSLTIAQAVENLCELGILEVQDKIGIFVKDPRCGLLTGRTIGVAIRNLAGSAYAATLAGYIQKLLNARNCRCLAFFQTSDPVHVPNPGLQDFPGLEQAVTEHRCDGIISCCPFDERAQKVLKEADIPCCFIGDRDQNTMDHAVVIDVDAFLAQAVRTLSGAGCGKLVQLCVSPEQAEKRSCGIRPLIGAGYSGGVEIARKLLQTPAAGRPDGIVSDDDTVVSGLLAELIKEQLPEVHYLPCIATIIHRELDECYPSGSMLLFEQSIEDFALLAVDLLLRLTQDRKTAGKQIIYRFNPIAGAAPKQKPERKSGTRRDHKDLSTK